MAPTSDGGDNACYNCDNEIKYKNQMLNCYFCMSGYHTYCTSLNSKCIDAVQESEYFIFVCRECANYREILNIDFTEIFTVSAKNFHIYRSLRNSMFYQAIIKGIIKVIDHQVNLYLAVQEINKSLNALAQNSQSRELKIDIHMSQIENISWKSLVENQSMPRINILEEYNQIRNTFNNEFSLIRNSLNQIVIYNKKLDDSLSICNYVVESQFNNFLKEFYSVQKQDKTLGLTSNCNFYYGLVYPVSNFEILNKIQIFEYLYDDPDLQSLLVEFNNVSDVLATERIYEDKKNKTEIQYNQRINLINVSEVKIQGDQDKVNRKIKDPISVFGYPFQIVFYNLNRKINCKMKELLFGSNTEVCHKWQINQKKIKCKMKNLINNVLECIHTCIFNHSKKTNCKMKNRISLISLMIKWISLLLEVVF